LSIAVTRPAAMTSASAIRASPPPVGAPAYGAAPTRGPARQRSERAGIGRFWWPQLPAPITRDTPTTRAPKPPPEPRVTGSPAATVSGMGHVIGYARVSTREQDPQAQEAELRAAGAVRVFVDHGQSSRTASRPEWIRCMDHLREGDTLVIRALDRIAGTEAIAIETIRELGGRGVR